MSTINLYRPEQDLRSKLCQLGTIADSGSYSIKYIVKINAIWEDLRELLELGTEKKNPWWKLEECFWGITSKAAEGVRSSDLETRRSNFILLRDLVKRGYAEREAAAAVEVSIGNLDDKLRLEGILLAKALAEKGYSLPIVIRAMERGLHDELLTIRQDAFWLWAVLRAKKKVDGLLSCSEKVLDLIEALIRKYPDLAFRLFDEARSSLTTDSAKCLLYLIKQQCNSGSRSCMFGLFQKVQHLLGELKIDTPDSTESTELLLTAMEDPFLFVKAEKLLRQSSVAIKPVVKRLSKWFEGSQSDLHERGWLLLCHLLLGSLDLSIAKEIILKRLQHENIDVRLEALSFIHKTMQKLEKPLLSNEEVLALVDQYGREEETRERHLAAQLLDRLLRKKPKIDFPLELVVSWLEDAEALIRLDAIALLGSSITLSNAPQIFEAAHNHLERHTAEALHLLGHLAEAALYSDKIATIANLYLHDRNLRVVEAIARLLTIFMREQDLWLDQAEELLYYYLKNSDLCWSQEGSINILQLAFKLILNRDHTNIPVAVLELGVQDETPEVRADAERIAVQLVATCRSDVAARVANYCKPNVRIALVEGFMKERVCLHAVWEFFSEYSAEKYQNAPEEERVALIEMVKLFIKMRPATIDLVAPLIAMFMVDGLEAIRFSLLQCALIIIFENYDPTQAIEIIQLWLAENDAALFWEAKAAVTQIINANRLDVAVKLMDGCEKIEIKLKILIWLVSKKRSVSEARSFLSKYDIANSSPKLPLDNCLQLLMLGVELIKIDPTSIALVEPLILALKASANSWIRHKILGLAQAIMQIGCDSSAAIAAIGDALEDSQSDIIWKEAVNVVCEMPLIAVALLSGYKRPAVAEALREKMGSMIRSKIV